MQLKCQLLKDVSKLLCLLTILSIVAASCSIKLSKFNQAYNYQPDNLQSQVQIESTSTADSTTLIQLQLPVYAAKKEYEDTESEIGLFIYNNWNEKRPIFESQTLTSFVEADNFITAIEIKIGLKENQKLKYIITAPFLKDDIKGIYSFSNKRYENSFTTITDSSIIINKDVTLKYQDYLFEPAKVPFVASEEKWQYNSKLKSISNDKLFARAGYYTVNNEGIYFAINDFPMLTTPDELLAPMRYITTDEEYQKLKTAQISKLQIDSFWYDMAGNYERARTIIKEFYSRVSYANNYFTSYKEGWMTDRGMLYIIYGPPDEVYEQNDVEIWYHAISDTKFIFDKIEIPGNNIHYVLQREIDLKDSWDIAINNWRNGQLKSTFKIED